ncbi:MAG: hypothetical protein KHX14_05230 [[Clostridium] spiroforme]|uniref:Uncharacterized protein n=1 Tax=Thomasclavelia spiroformis TaxID=29348 RepID=A0A943I7J5_9FIRM|nr:hypothetical protein [Thomasclavelia spiroformis]MBS5588206.1 hypothetical protein [Thomasclavelia spiroformis]
MSKYELLKHGENRVVEGLEDDREEILEISKLMYEKIKHFGKKDREAILDIMKALSNVSGA